MQNIKRMFYVLSNSKNICKKTDVRQMNSSQEMEEHKKDENTQKWPKNDSTQLPWEE